MTPAAEAEGKGGPAEVGKAAPDLKVTTVNGQGAVTLESLSGKIAVVDFWATWCGPCKQSFPKLEELAKQNVGKVQVVGISVDDSSDGVADFAKVNGATFPVGWDEGHSIAGRWKVETMPTTYILDATGTVRFIHAGYKDGEADVMAKEIASLSDPGGGKTGAVVVELADKGAPGGEALPQHRAEPPPPPPTSAATKEGGGESLAGRKSLVARSPRRRRRSRRCATKRKTPQPDSGGMSLAAAPNIVNAESVPSLK